uniref:Uncharacterized protein n=1 Tax=Romanomermis culicivorax TaxID=13658 RepID=A0A915K0W2_ROMCU
MLCFGSVVAKRRAWAGEERPGKVQSGKNRPFGPIDSLIICLPKAFRRFFRQALFDNHWKFTPTSHRLTKVKNLTDELLINILYQSFIKAAKKFSHTFNT